MRKKRLNCRICRKMLSIVMLLSFLKFQAFAEPLIMPPMNLNEGGMRLYTDFEIGSTELTSLIDEISEIAIEAIEKAAAEAARAAALAGLEREAAALFEAERWRREATLNLQRVEKAKRTGRKNTVIAVLAGIVGGLAIGVSGTLIIGR